MRDLGSNIGENLLERRLLPEPLSKNFYIAEIGFSQGENADFGKAKHSQTEVRKPTLQK